MEDYFKELVIANNSEVYSVAYSPDGRNIASGSYDKTIKIWDVSNLLVQTGGKKIKLQKKKN
jgi:WD40 repeat protein